MCAFVTITAKRTEREMGTEKVSTGRALVYGGYKIVVI